MSTPDRRSRPGAERRAGRAGAPLALLGAAVALMACPGCLERRIQITSDPPGALVWVNDVEIGRTPAETTFLYYGTYDVRLRKEGYEPVAAHRRARGPWYEFPPLDLVGTALPLDVESTVRWHFDLQPVAEAAGSEPALLERAAAMRERVEPPQ